MDMEMSMDIIEMARDLGRALQADEKYQLLCECHSGK